MLHLVRVVLLRPSHLSTRKNAHDLLRQAALHGMPFQDVLHVSLPDGLRTGHLRLLLLQTGVARVGDGAVLRPQMHQMRGLRPGSVSFNARGVVM